MRVVYSSHYGVQQDHNASRRLYGQAVHPRLRFPVSRLLGLLASGQSRDEILRAYPFLEPADIDEALRYAASLAEDEVIELSG